jgi:hypothetical protein
MPLVYNARFILKTGEVVTDTITLTVFPPVFIKNPAITFKNPKNTNIHKLLANPKLLRITGETFNVHTVCDRITLLGRVYKVSQEVKGNAIRNVATPLHAMRVDTVATVLKTALPSPVRTNYTVGINAVFAGTPVRAPPIAAVAETVAYIALTRGQPQACTFYGTVENATAPSDAFEEYYAWSEGGLPTHTIPCVEHRGNHGETTTFNCCPNGTYTLIVHLTTDPTVPVHPPKANEIVAQITPASCWFDKSWAGGKNWASIILHGSQFKARIASHAANSRLFCRENTPSKTVRAIVPSTYTASPLEVRNDEAAKKPHIHNKPPVPAARKQPMRPIPADSVRVSRPNVPL